MENYTVKICGKEVEIRKTFKQAIKAYCTDCSAGNRTEVSECPVKDCPLFPYRGFIITDGNKRVMSEEQKEAARQRLLKYHKESRISSGV